MTRMQVRCWEPVQAHRQLLDTVWPMLKAKLTAGARMVLELREETRTELQNKFLHALIGDVAKQAQYMGKRRTPSEWKVLFVSGHAIVTKEGAEMVPGLEGEFVNIRESTATMSRRRSASLCEYILAYCAHNGIELREARQWIDPETGEVM